MYTRSDSIAAAEGGTFAWMVGSEAEQQDGQDAAPVASIDEQAKRDMTRQCFLTWLASGRHLFHISGKAGSGKSTLMKFLARSSRVQAELRRWAGDNPLIFAQFFFWNSGDRLQASLEGLYRSLLFEICRQSPDLIPRIFPDIWAGLLVGVAPPHDTPISLEEVKQAFDLFTQQISSLPSYICLFIDGLDEFEGDEVDHWHLARYLQSWTQSPNIKLCVSSRPHVTFLQSFASSVNRQINIHELTREDICQFSLAMFEKDPNFARIKDSYRELVDDIVGHSNGVFLWARLAVRSLLRSVGYQVTGEELKRKLKAMPKGLDGLFDQILGSINPEDQSLSDTLFLLTIPDFCRWQPIVGSAIAYSWLEDLANPDFPWKQPMRACSETEIKERLDRVSCLLDRLSRGLLEMFPKRSRDVDGHDYFVYEVRFLHRTAREYLAGTRQREMETRVPDIDVYSGILRLMLAEFKFARPTLRDLSRNLSQYGSRGGPLRTHLNKTITVMQSAIAQGYEIPRRILEEFSTIASGHAQPVDTPQQDSRCQTECHLRGQNLQTSLSDCWPTIRESNYPSCIFSEFTLRSMQALLPPDLRCQLKRQTLESGPNLLLVACDSGDVELVLELLQDGRTPGEIVELEVVYGHCEDPGQGDTKGAETASVWLLCLSRFGYSCLSMRNHTRSVIVELLLRAGADGNVQFIITKRSSEGLQREVTNDTLAGANAEQVTGRKYVMSLLELVELVEPPNLKEIRAILESRRSWWDRLTRWTLTSNLQNVEDDESESFKRVYKSALPAEGTYAPFGILGDFYIESVITPSERLDLPFSFRVT